MVYPLRHFQDPHNSDFLLRLRESQVPEDKIYFEWPHPLYFNLRKSYSTPPLPPSLCPHMRNLALKTIPTLCGT
jgi:hypothetical protein